MLWGVFFCFEFTAWGNKDGDVELVIQPGIPLSRATLVPTFTSTPTSTPIQPPPGAPTPTSTRVVSDDPDPIATLQAIQNNILQAENRAQVLGRLQNASFQPAGGGSGLDHVPPIPFAANERRRVLAHYFAWFDNNSWNECNMSDGDKPLEPYHSDDPAAIGRHIQMARDIGLNGFTLHWFAPGDRTDRNFGTLLSLSEGTDFASSVVFSHHIWHGPHSRESVAQALRHIINQHGQHPNFLRLNHQPVIFFTDIYRTPSAPGESPHEFWASIRNQVDPQHQTWWIAEGLDASYLGVFDGLYVFKVTHADHPHDYTKSARWADRVRAMAQWTGRPKLWVATIIPGWDDRTATCKPDVRAPSPAHRLDRANGATFENTFKMAMASNPDWLIVGSFNEWVEGSYIEPGVIYGDKYMQMARELIRRFQRR